MWRSARSRDRQGQASAPPEAPSHSSVFRLLRDHEELTEALRRAAEYEQQVADRLRRRSERYSALINPPADASNEAVPLG